MAGGEPVYIVIMFVSIFIDYTHGLLVEKYRSNDRKARWFVGQSIVFNLLLLGFSSTGRSSLRTCICSRESPFPSR